MDVKGSYEEKTLKKVTDLKKSIVKDLEKMEKLLSENKESDPLKKAFFYRDKIIPLMGSVRKNTDELELITDRKYWPMPSYRELLFGVD